MEWLRQNKKLIARLVTPSVGSGVITAIAAATVISLLVAPQLFNNDQIQQYMQFTQENPTPLQQQFQNVNISINSSGIAANSAVFIIWGFAGLVGYALLASIGRGIHNLIQFEKNVEYFEGDRQSIIREALVHTVARLSAVGLLICLYFLGMYVILPAVVVAVQLALDAPLALAAASIIGAFLLSSITIHTLIVLTRLLLLRTRIFFERHYVAE